jgi:hypothetical protein
MYYVIGKYVYFDDPDAIGLMTRCGEVVFGIDGYYIEWYA